MHDAQARSKLFVGSSSSGREIADRLAAALADSVDVTTWCDGSSAPPPSPPGFDAAAFALGGAPEWGLYLRLGVFLGALGRDRIILVPPESRTVHLPSELGGLMVATELDTIREHLRRLAAQAAPATVARRKRRSLGSAAATRPGQPLRIADISLSGALLETYGEMPPNQPLDLELALENGRHIRVAAKVVRVQHPQWGRVGGVGVKFLQFEGDSYATLAEFLEEPSAS